jgi:hypothetical protein
MESRLSFDWDNPDALLAQVRSLLTGQGERIRRVPKRAIRRGAFELLRLVQQRLPKKTSTLVRSVHVAIQEISKDLVEGRVGTWLKYAQYLEEGTGVYGPRKTPILILPRAKKALYWGASDENGLAIVRRRAVIKGIKPRGDWAAAIAEFLPRYVAIIQEELAKESAA